MHSCSSSFLNFWASLRSRPMLRFCWEPLASCCCRRGLPATGRWLAFGSLIALAILGLSPVGNVLFIPLENRFPPWDAARGAPDGIIVLGGVIDASSPGNQIMLKESAARLTVVPDLARRYPNARIQFLGGSGALMDDGSAEARAAARGCSRVSAFRQIASSLRIGLAIRWRMQSFPK
jgi:hypothetical protein